MDRTETRLTPEDQEKVDRFIHSGVNAKERDDFKPLKLMLWLLLLIIVIGVFSRLIGFFILP